MAEEVKKNPKRFGGFCSLSMHRPAQAAQELRRSVKELGLVGAIVNDWQATGEDGNGILLYDTPDFDPFWEAVQELDVPIYFHPKVESTRDLTDCSGQINIKWRLFTIRGSGLWELLVNSMFN